MKKHKPQVFNLEMLHRVIYTILGVIAILEWLHRVILR